MRYIEGLIYMGETEFADALSAQYEIGYGEATAIAAAGRSPTGERESACGLAAMDIAAQVRFAVMRAAKEGSDGTESRDG